MVNRHTVHSNLDRPDKDVSCQMECGIGQVVMPILIDVSKSLVSPSVSQVLAPVPCPVVASIPSVFAKAAVDELVFESFRSRYCFHS